MCWKPGTKTAYIKNAELKASIKMVVERNVLFDPSFDRKVPDR
jgi:hypothetical protein